MNKTLLCCLLTFIGAPCIAAPLGEGAFDMVSISADEAHEDEQADILHFRGHFRMRSDDWQLTAAAATVYGSPDKPDRVWLEGTPAQFTVYQAERTEAGRITASAAVVEYVRADNRLVLSGGATLMLGDEVIRSKHIQYDISTNRYQAGGADGVLIEVPPID